MKNNQNRYWLLVLFFQLMVYTPSLGKQKTDAEQMKQDLELIWPLVQTVKIEYDLALVQLEFCKTKDEKKQFLTEFELFIKEKYFKKVLALNLRQGRLLILLIGRELNKTPFDLLKEYLSVDRAIFWKRFAKLVGANLKEKYNPQEHILIEAEIHQLMQIQHF